MAALEWRQRKCFAAIVAQIDVRPTCIEIVLHHAFGSRSASWRKSCATADIKVC